MRFPLGLALAIGLAVLAVAGIGTTGVAQSAGCGGAWLVRVSLEGRAVDERALFAFQDDGAVEVHAPPVLPALPGEGEIPLPASGGLGAWEETAPGACAFEYVRVLAGEDGVSVGTLDVRGTAAVDAGSELTGSLTYTRATDFGQTAATASGSFTGASLSGPLLWVTPAATP